MARNTGGWSCHRLRWKGWEEQAVGIKAEKKPGFPELPEPISGDGRGAKGRDAGDPRTAAHHPPAFRLLLCREAPSSAPPEGQGPPLLHTPRGGLSRAPAHRQQTARPGTPNTAEPPKRRRCRPAQPLSALCPVVTARRYSREGKEPDPSPSEIQCGHLPAAGLTARPPRAQQGA